MTFLHHLTLAMPDSLLGLFGKADLPHSGFLLFLSGVGFLLWTQGRHLQPDMRDWEEAC